ncbi:MAG: hypothetical protein H7336_03550 [Bacteriovorax sp.]|nr:hypothetical protein [Bacteriovorax sp.]
MSRYIGDKYLEKFRFTKISDLDKDLIISALIEINPALNRKKTSETPDEDGKMSIKIGYGEIETPQDEEESLSDYYYRLNILHEERFNKTSERLANKLNFSSSLNKELSSMMSGMSNIQNTLDKLNVSQRGLFRGQDNKVLGVIQEIPKEIFLPDLSLIKDHKLEALRKLDDQISTMPAKMDEAITVMTLMLSELKGSSDDAGESLKLTVQSLKVTVKSLKWTIGLSMIGLIVSSFSLYLAFNTSDAGKTLVPHIEMIKESLDKKNALEEKKLHLMEQSVSQNQILIKLIQADKKKTSRIRN